MEYAKIVDNDIEKAPSGGVHWNGAFWPTPSRAIYAACDEGPFYPLHNAARTTAPTGTHWTTRTGWELVSGEIWGVYSSEADAVNVQVYDDAMEAEIRRVREARGYTTREPTFYTTSSNAQFAKDAQVYTEYVTACMAYGNAQKAAAASTGVIPTVEAFVAGMPTCNWVEVA